MNDWTRVEAELFTDTTLSRGTLQQAWRWTASAREWLDHNEIEVQDVNKGDIERYLRDVPVDRVKDHEKRIWAFKLLVSAARRVAPPRSKDPHSARARLDQVPGRSPLGKALAQVLAGAKSRADRSRWMTCLGTFLGWCDTRGIPTDDIWAGDIDAFRRDYLASGRTAPGEYVRMARRLVAELQRQRSVSL